MLCFCVFELVWDVLFDCRLFFACFCFDVFLDLFLAIQIWPRIGKTWPESQSLSPCGSIPFFAESNVANERSSANEGDEGSESNERSVYRSQAIKAIKAMKTPLKLVDVFFMFCLA